MSVKIGEIGKIIYVYTNGFDLSANTELGIKFTPPTDGDQTEFTRTSADGVTAPVVPSPTLPNLGILPANEYFQYSTQAADFTDVGDWCVNGEYTEGATKFYIGDDGTLTVEDVC
jgi:hypothetical protein